MLEELAYTTFNLFSFADLKIFSVPVTFTSKYSSQSRFEVDQLKESIIFLEANKDRSIIISEYQFINSEIDHNIYPPNRWYTSDGVSYPIKGNKYHENYKSRRSIK